MGPIEPEVWLNLCFRPSTPALSPCCQGKAWSTPESPVPGMSIWLWWIWHLFFSNLTASWGCANSISQGGSIPATPCITWPHFCLLLPLHDLHQEVQNAQRCDFSLHLSPFLTSRCVTLEDFIWFCFICCMAPTRAAYPISDVAKFHPLWKEVYQLWTFTAGFQSKLMSLTMYGWSRFMWRACLVSHTIRATNCCLFQPVTKTYLHLEGFFEWKS